MQKRSGFDFLRRCRRFAILFDSCTDLLLICGPSGSGKTNVLINMILELLYCDKIYIYDLWKKIRTI